MRAWITAIVSFCAMNSYSLLNRFNWANIEISSKRASSYETHLLGRGDKQLISKLKHSMFGLMSDNFMHPPMWVLTHLQQQPASSQQKFEFVWHRWALLLCRLSAVSPQCSRQRIKGVKRQKKSPLFTDNLDPDLAGARLRVSTDDSPFTLSASACTPLHKAIDCMSVTSAQCEQS